MLFNTIEYIIFLIAAVAGYYIIPGRLSWLWVLVMSAFFYYTLSPLYLLVFLTIILLNYLMARIIERYRESRKSIFIVSIIVNILVLAFPP